MISPTKSNNRSKLKSAKTVIFSSYNIRGIPNNFCGAQSFYLERFFIFLSTLLNSSKVFYRYHWLICSIIPSSLLRGFIGMALEVIFRRILIWQGNRHLSPRMSFHVFPSLLAIRFCFITPIAIRAIACYTKYHTSQVNLSSGLLLSYEQWFQNIKCNINP